MDPAALLVSLLVTNPAALRVALIVLGVGATLAFAWKLVPTETRDAFERQHPRIAGVIRIVVALWPSIVDAGRAASVQVAQGKPKADVATDYKSFRAVVTEAIDAASKSDSLPESLRRTGRASVNVEVTDHNVLAKGPK